MFEQIIINKNRERREEEAQEKEKKRPEHIRVSSEEANTRASEALQKKHDPVADRHHARFPEGRYPILPPTADVLQEVPSLPSQSDQGEYNQVVAEALKKQAAMLRNNQPPPPAPPSQLRQSSQNDTSRQPHTQSSMQASPQVIPTKNTPPPPKNIQATPSISDTLPLSNTVSNNRIQPEGPKTSTPEKPASSPEPTDSDEAANKQARITELRRLSEENKQAAEKAFAQSPQTLEAFKQRNAIITKDLELDRELNTLEDKKPALLRVMRPEVKNLLSNQSHITTGKDGIKSYHDRSGTDWHVTESFVPNQADWTNQQMHLSREVDGRTISAQIPLGVLRGGDQEAIESYIQREENRDHLEREDPAGIRDFDLPRDRKIGFAGIGGDDTALYGNRDYRRWAPELLREQGYDVEKASGSDAFFDENRQDPSRELDRQITTLQKNGIRDIVLNIDAHGSPTGEMYVGRDVPYGGNFSGKALMDIVRKYPDTNFTIHGTSCYNGGMDAAYNSLTPEEKERCTLFLGTTPENIDMTSGGSSAGYDISQGYHDPAEWESRWERERGTQGSAQDASSTQDALFYHYLGEGMPYGQAWLRADRESKKHVLINPRAYRNGKLTAQNTLDQDRNTTRGNV